MPMNAHQKKFNKLRIPSLVPRNPFWKTKRSTIPHQDKRRRQKHKGKDYDD